MELKEIQETLSGYGERIARISLFVPLYELGRKKQVDHEGKPIDFSGLGLLTLLYFFEQKLMRNQRTGVKELAIYLEKVSKDQLKLDSTGYEELARTIIQNFRPSTGKKREYPFFNWETKQNDQAYCSILKANSFDMKTNSQYYTLDDDGLELVFATKEYYSEFQLSINQLVLRKQLEKGEFKGALRQINEMRIDVESLQERMVKLQHEIKRNIVSEDTLQRYKSLLEDIYSRLSRENEEFVELHVFVNETKEHLYYKDNQQQEIQAYELILQISNELEEVHAEHTKLLQQSIDMKNKALQAAEESLYYMGIDSFNFDQEITSRVISAPLPLEAMKGVLSPFFTVQETKQWSLLTIFAEQNISEERDEERDEAFLEPEDDHEQTQYKVIQRKNYMKLMKLLLHSLQDKSTMTLQDFIEELKQSENKQILDQRFFYDFWILLHQHSPLQKREEDVEIDETSHVVDSIVSLLEQQQMRITETDKRLQVTERYSIQDMKIEIGGEDQHV
jgi:hypothetical protein